MPVRLKWSLYTLQTKSTSEEAWPQIKLKWGGWHSLPWGQARCFSKLKLLVKLFPHSRRMVSSLGGFWKSHALVTHNLHTYKFLKTVSHISYQKRNHGDISFSTINKKNTNTKTRKCRVIFSCHPSTWSWVKSFCGCSGGVVWWVGEVVLLRGVVPGHPAPCLVLQGVARIAGFSFRTLLQW